ncbi:PREDICTED: uncharacterized protein LOC107186181 [Dufourea novaeangliae]|uniref:uncharacterized protein LOC107186181 n=1 Tax=Dufourea novaeangliae TaxID=178035 RepID=UPI000766F51C|nr:PREDICTED: uncharacterized protein LOC107186181 [Dufourea novaeangliae]
MANAKCWNFEKDEMLIELVKANDGLYNLQSPFYSDNNYKRKIWNGIEKSLNQNDAKVRWESLRSQYRKYLNKQKTKSGQAAIKVAKWKFHDQMAFLSEFVNIERPRVTSIEHEENFIEGEENLSSAGKDVEDPTTSQNKNEQNRHNNTQNVNKTQKTRARETASTTLLKYLLEKKEEESKTPDPIANCFSVMADSVKTFTPLDQHFVKTKIFSLINDIEAKYLMQSPSHFTQTTQSSHNLQECQTNTFMSNYDEPNYENL